MPSPNTVDEVLNTLRAAFPQGLSREVEQHVGAALKTLFARLDLVTREEMDVQEAVLARTRQKLEQLERTVAELEQTLKK